MWVAKVFGWRVSVDKGARDGFPKRWSLVSTNKMADETNKKESPRTSGFGAQEDEAGGSRESCPIEEKVRKQKGGVGGFYLDIEILKFLI